MLLVLCFAFILILLGSGDGKTVVRSSAYGYATHQAFFLNVIVTLVVAIGLLCLTQS
jgi:isoprenylcysteine carboxyl methyltransferase (ICMT) family protein YpbQ